MASPQNLVPVTDAASPAEAHIIASMLRESVVEAFVFDTASQALPWEGVQSIHPFSVHVQQADLELAQQLIQTNREESVDLDWSEVDVGEPNDDERSTTNSFTLRNVFQGIYEYVFKDWLLIIMLVLITLLILGLNI